MTERRKASSAESATRFGIAEWYGASFVDMTSDERRAAASFALSKLKGVRLTGPERKQLAALRFMRQRGIALKPEEEGRFAVLSAKRTEELKTSKICPFRAATENDLCNKAGGVCSLRVYEQTPGGVAPLTGAREGIRALCPSRFMESRAIFQWIGSELLGDNEPALAAEIGFLESTGTVDAEAGADVGRIDMVLVNNKLPKEFPMEWCAVEMQAVYFSGEEMGQEFRAILDQDGAALPFPAKVRRPDYRSSGPKRLMPQLQTKVPTLRRWGKKMAVVVDRAFFDSMGEMARVADPSNADIGWFVVKFEHDPGEKRFRLVPDFSHFTTLEQSVDGLTAGAPVPMHVFQARIRERLGTESYLSGLTGRESG